MLHAITGFEELFRRWVVTNLDAGCSCSPRPHRRRGTSNSSRDAEGFSRYRGGTQLEMLWRRRQFHAIIKRGADGDCNILTGKVLTSAPLSLTFDEWRSDNLDLLIPMRGVGTRGASMSTSQPPRRRRLEVVE